MVFMGKLRGRLCNDLRRKKAPEGSQGCRQHQNVAGNETQTSFRHRHLLKWIRAVWLTAIVDKKRYALGLTPL
jgi:hypothetical protein